MSRVVKFVVARMSDAMRKIRTAKRLYNNIEITTHGPELEASMPRVPEKLGRPTNVIYRLNLVVY